MMTVREVAAMREVETKYGIAWLQHSRIGFHVGLRSRVGLHISVLGAEKFFGALARQILHNVSEFTTPVIAFARISFGVFIREHRAHGFQHCFADEVLRGDQLQALVLPPDFVVYRVRHLRSTSNSGADILFAVFISYSPKHSDHSFSGKPRLYTSASSSSICLSGDCSGVNPNCAYSPCASRVTKLQRRRF